MKWPQNLFHSVPVAAGHSLALSPGCVLQPGIPGTSRCSGREQGWEQREESPQLPLQVLEGEFCSLSLLVSSTQHPLSCPSLGESGPGGHLGHEALQAGGTNPSERGTEPPPPPGLCEEQGWAPSPGSRDLCSLWGHRIETTTHFWGSSRVAVKLLLPRDAGGKGEKKTPTRPWKLLSFLSSFQNSTINRNKLLGAVNSEGLCAKLEQAGLCWEQLIITQTGSERGWERWRIMKL